LRNPSSIFPNFHFKFYLKIEIHVHHKTHFFVIFSPAAPTFVAL
jgi:hypothetical protein